MVDRKKLGDKLRTLRESKFPERSDLKRKSGIAYTQIQTTEDGATFPRIDLLEKWLVACGTTLSRFFADLEAESGEASEVQVVPGFEEYYRDLTRIIRSREKFFIQGIHANLQSLARTSEEIAKARPQDSRKEQAGNVARKEKKRAAG